jgi:hypothetical protein
MFVAQAATGLPFLNRQKGQKKRLPLRCQNRVAQV